MGEELWAFYGNAIYKNVTEHMQTFLSELEIGLDLVGHVQPKIANLILATSTLSFYLNCSYLKSLLPRYSYSRFPYQENTVNQWFVHEFLFFNGEQKAVNVINVDQASRRARPYRIQDEADNFPERLSDDQFDVFYHGTNHNNAKNIIECGIDLSKGEEAQDFSDGDGFYLGNSFDEANEWAQEHFNVGEAVLIYRVDKNQLRGQNNQHNGLDLSNDRQEWHQVVEEYQQSRSGRPKKGLRKTWKRHGFIEGPRASWRNRNRTTRPRNPTVNIRNDTYQLCVKNEGCARLFDHSLHSVVFFER